jgi:putative oxidoreductase
VGVIELVVGVLVALGVFTRIAAILGSGTMAYAYFTAHQPKGLLPIENGGEPAVLFCFAFLLIAFAGAGAFAGLDRDRHAVDRLETQPGQ